MKVRLHVTLFFQARGYPEALLNGDLCKISTVSRNEALRPPVERDATESRVPMVLTYNIDTKSHAFRPNLTQPRHSDKISLFFFKYYNSRKIF